MHYKNDLTKIVCNAVKALKENNGSGHKYIYMLMLKEQLITICRLNIKTVRFALKVAVANNLIEVTDKRKLKLKRRTLKMSQGLDNKNKKLTTLEHGSKSGCLGHSRSIGSRKR